MPCYSPLTGYVSKVPSKNGKFPIVFDYKKGWIDRKVSVPCGQCIGCRLEKSRQWAIRCVHEASLHGENCFITLTYDDENLPEGGSLVKADFQKFMKRLRKQYGSGIRYFHCGEYGDINGRPHHHACVFGFRFPDCQLLDMSGRPADCPPLFVSHALSKLWPFGLHTIGDVTFDSAAYVARYVTKKITGDRAAAHYNGRVPEYTTMSRRPGLGSGWFDEYKSDCYPSDRLVIRGGVVCKPPKYYDDKFTGEDPETMSALKQRRLKNAVANPHNHGSRLLVRNKVELARCKMFLKRRLEK